MNRRVLLTGAAAAGGVASMAPPAEGVAVTTTPSPDANLVGACAEYLRINREFEAYCTTIPGDIKWDDARADAIRVPLADLLDRIIALRATTAEGHLARGQCRAFGLLPNNAQCQDEPDAASYDRLDAAELRDLVQMECGRQGLHQPLRLDATLLETCAAFDALERAYHATAFNVRADTPEDLAAAAERRCIQTEQDIVVERMCAIRAVTREGMAARARSLALWDGELLKDARGDVGELLAAAIVRDLLASDHSVMTGQSEEVHS